MWLEKNILISEDIFFDIYPSPDGDWRKQYTKKRRAADQIVYHK